MRRFVVGLLLVLVGVLLTSTPVLAIGNPDYVSIGDKYVFEDVLESGDQLYFCRYDASYSSTPSEDADETWEMALYNGAVLVATRPLNYYQHNIISIYLDADEALVSGGEYTIKIRGMPSVFEALVEGVNMRTATLSPEEWIAGTDLGSYMLAQADILQTDWAITLLDGGKLNATGSTYFRAAIPGLNTMDPTIFQTTTRLSDWPGYTNWTTNYTDNTTTRTGDRLRNAINGTMSIFGIGSEGWGGSWMLGIMGVLLAAPVYAGTKNPMWALIVLFPVFLGAAWIGVGTAEMLRGLLIFVLVLGVIFALTFWLRHMG